ncbi:hypothetical protein BCR34DRAFT_545265 [Clohesyomyces aquaticus]|uniref:Uncharacterized protein n=1 Tax=Clohesyomyces aquaticus TaxID=1231657 RepID=A0A1Y1YYV5_9PLEO|nr:hypothetical protein BCR34DRAFT_545265 [Clohesyomyces aquaticus]
MNGQKCRFQHLSGARQQDIKKGKPPCTFFLQGACRKEDSCTFAHVNQAPVTVLNHPGPRDPRSSIPCTFFQRGICNKGGDCPFGHDIAGSVSISETPWAGSYPPTKLQNENDSSRTIGRATVLFTDGFSLSTLSLPSDFSAVSMSGMSADVSVREILGLLEACGFPEVPSDCVHLMRIPQKSTQTAHVKLRDPDFAEKFLQCLGGVFFLQDDDKPVQISVLQVGGETESGMNRLQLTGITCTWYNPSKVAYLQYGTGGHATMVLERFKKLLSKDLRNRKLDITYQPVGSLRVGNLDPCTTEAELRRFLPDPQPLKVTWGPRSHKLTAKQLEDKARAKIESQGTLVEWVITTHTGGSRTKAVAKFTEAEAARNAVREMNDTVLDITSNDKLRVSPLVSIKLSVSYRILQTLRPQLDALAKQSWASNYVSIKCYEPLGKLYTQVRIFGQSKGPVADAKSAVEKLLAGHVAVDGGTPISDAFFFKPSSKEFLDGLMTTHSVFIHQDLRKTILRLYGDHANIDKAEQALATKRAELKVQSHTIILDAETLAFALKGGLRQIIAALGKDRVKMDIISNPKRITVKGSELHLAQVHEMLQTQASLPFESRAAALSLTDENEDMCPVCWTPPDEPFRTACDHVYCNSCLVSQCTSADVFPVQCLGDAGTCNKPLTLGSLKQILSVSEYGNVLQASLASHLRSRPTEFQYCPTPDCNRFYRVSPLTKPRTFDCDGCLSSLCTSCHNVTHDGLSCEAYTALVKAEAAGEKELEQWKKDHDVRDCPKCSVPIEKSYGCNHMTCVSCGTHICWFCMKTFTSSGATYDHMQRSHRGTGLF